MKRIYLIGVATITALLSSACCIFPLIALFGGASGGASALSWLEPFRPFLMILSVLALGFAFYKAYKPKKADNCGCAVKEKKSFLASKGFLWGITVFSILMYSFPYYSSVFYSGGEKNVATNVNNEHIQNVKLSIKGMTCTGCENHIHLAINKLDGIIELQSSYENGSSIVKFDESKIAVQAIINSIEKETGYQVSNHKIINN